MAELREGVRRRLFQDDTSVDAECGEAENITNSLREQLKRDREDARDRWNFDFEKEEPLPGRWQWVKEGDEGFDNVVEDDEEYVLANDELDNSNHADHHSDHSNDVFVDACNVSMPMEFSAKAVSIETSTGNQQCLDNNNSSSNN